MEKRIVFKNLDGTCGIIIPSPNASKIVEGKEIPLTLKEIADKSVPEGLEYRIVNVSKIPSDRTFRGSWTDDLPGEQIDIDMDKAKVIHMDRIRDARKERFEEMGFPVKLDEDLEKAIIPEEKRQILQALRNIPKDIDLSKATTPEELKEIWPAEL